jgi:hypothetical protein
VKRAAARLALALAAAVGAVPVEPTVAQEPVAAPAAPSEIDGQINGKKAHFVAQGDDVLVSAAEAGRVGLPYLGGKSISIGGTTVWLVTLDAVTVDGKTRLLWPAGVVASIPGYFEALRAHPAEALARSREMAVEINGTQVPAYDLGDGGVLMSIDAAEQAGVPWRQGKREAIGQTIAWVVEAAVKVKAQAAQTKVIVTDPQAFFEAMLAGARPAP